jgi:tetrapyrrole methylase family protein / MazG family protein
MTKLENKNIEKLVEIIRHLRSPDGCPWDKKQTHESLKPMLVEEAAELLDAIDNKDVPNIREELGDLLMHIVFHSLIAEENGEFNFDDVAKEVSEKMLRRHPHIFGDKTKPDTADEVVLLWQEIKAQEKKHKKILSILDGIPHNLPALDRAEQIQIKAANVGFDWRNTNEVFDKLEEEIAELRVAFKNNSDEEIEDELGDVLFSVVNICRFRDKTKSEDILHSTTDKFIRRFNFIEKEVAKTGKNLEDYSIDKLEELWQKAKNNV